MDAKLYNAETVPLSHTLGVGQRDSCRFIETGHGTDTTQGRLKALANSILERDKQGDSLGTDTHKTVPAIVEKNAQLSHLQNGEEIPLQSCISCPFWMPKKQSAWWIGLCGMSAKNIGHRDKCHMGLRRWEYE